jgi:hypothetical protein
MLVLHIAVYHHKVVLLLMICTIRKSVVVW